MGKTGSFIHSTIETGLAIGATNVYDVTRRVSLALNKDVQNTAFVLSRGVGLLGALYIHVNTIAGGATSLIVRLSGDTTGDEPWIGDTTATISTGITTATAGAVTIKIDVPFIKTSNDQLFLHCRTNVGTCLVDRVELTWRE